MKLRKLGIFGIDFQRWAITKFCILRTGSTHKENIQESSIINESGNAWPKKKKKKESGNESSCNVEY